MNSAEINPAGKPATAADKIYNVKAVRQRIFQLLAEYPNAEELLVDEIAGGWEGSNQWKTAAEFFEVEIKEKEWAWEKIEKVADAVAEELNEQLKDLPGRICFGHRETDGSYSLMFITKRGLNL